VVYGNGYTQRKTGCEGIHGQDSDDVKSHATGSALRTRGGLL